MIAIDPSSPISGGAVLGDRIRMGANAAHENVFIRSFSARGELGGLSRAARAAVDAFDACGFDRVIVETVGTGQSETRIVALADTRVVVCPPGLGDDVQAIKAGTLEIADVLAISKGDLPLAEQTAREMREMLTLRRRRATGEWPPRVVVVSALARTGLDELLGALDAHRDAVGVGRRAGRRRARPARARIAEGGEPAETKGTRCRRLAASASPAWSPTTALCATLGITFRAGGPGRAEVAMTVDARHLNFNGGCHGGAIFALADSAFGLASNSHGPVAAGIDAHITFQAAVAAPATRWSRARPRCSAAGASASTASTSSARTAAAARRAVSSFTGTVYIKG